MEQERPDLPAAAPVRGPVLEFEAIYREHSDYVYNLAFRLTGHPGEADDLLQDAFLRAFRYLDGYAGGSLRGWLRRIVVNLFMTRCRTRSRQTHVSLDAQDEKGRSRKVDEALRDASGDPAWCMEQGSLDGRLQMSLEAIPEEFRTALILREVDDLSYEQIASLMGVPIGTVRSRLARARAMLRDRLGESS